MTSIAQAAATAATALLAQQRPAPSGDLFHEILLLAGIIAGAAVVIAVVAFFIKRRLAAPTEVGEGFTLSDLRRMHKDGALSEEEYEAARRAMIARGLSSMPDETTPPVSRGQSIQPPGPPPTPPVVGSDEEPPDSQP